MGDDLKGFELRQGSYYLLLLLRNKGKGIGREDVPSFVIRRRHTHTQSSPTTGEYSSLILHHRRIGFHSRSAGDSSFGARLFAVISLMLCR